VREQLWLVAALLALAIVGWAVTHQRMAGMDADPGTDPGTLGFYTGVWVVMMAAAVRITAPATVAGRWRDVLSDSERAFREREPAATLLGGAPVAVFERVTAPRRPAAPRA
jgi:hypothetical protein